MPGARRPADAARGVRRARRAEARLRRRRQQRRALARAASARLAGVEVAVASPAGYELEPAAGATLTDDPRRGRRRRARRLHRRLGVDGRRGRPRTSAARRSSPTGSTTRCSTRAAPGAIALHCLPAHPGEEITAEVLYGAAPAHLGPGGEPPPRPEGAARVAASRPDTARSATVLGSARGGTMPQPKSSRVAHARVSSASRRSTASKAPDENVVKGVGALRELLARAVDAAHRARARGRRRRRAPRPHDPRRRRGARPAASSPPAAGRPRTPWPTSSSCSGADALDRASAGRTGARRLACATPAAFPIAGYDDLAAAQITQRLDDLTARRAAQGARLRAQARQPQDGRSRPSIASSS